METINQEQKIYLLNNFFVFPLAYRTTVRLYFTAFVHIWFYIFKDFVVYLFASF